MNFWENITKSLKERKGEFTGLNEKQLSKAIDQTNKGKSTKITNPTSYRTNHQDGSQDVGLTSGEAIPVESTAIESITYDPENENAEIEFINGRHPYDYPMTPEEYRSFLTSPSKGQWIQTARTYY